MVNVETRLSESCTTSGINPLYHNEESIRQLLMREFTLSFSELDHLFFYGAGCINSNTTDIVQRALNRHFKSSSVTIQSDLMCAARSLCKDRPGIACILGTGSNSCYYDGTEISRHISPLGYILGDEGSGAVIGRKFISDLLKNQLPAYVTDRFYQQYQLTAGLILETVYKKPFPNRFLAQFTRFIHENIQEPKLKNLVKESFNDFFIRNIRQYPEAQHLPINFTGSIAYYFNDVLQESAAELGHKTGIISVSPMKGLIEFHLKNL